MRKTCSFSDLVNDQRRIFFLNGDSDEFCWMRAEDTVCQESGYWRQVG